MGKQQAVAGTSGEILRLSLQPYGHTGGTWNFISRDAPGAAFLDIMYGTTHSITINNSGDVGIGTTNTQGYKLAVAGMAIAEELVVELETEWPDYVFEKDHQLPSLTELEAYIQQNKHLPEVPTAEEVKENGLKIGEMNALLLKKVEELTLYMIELKKENEKLQSKYSELEAKLEKQ